MGQKQDTSINYVQKIQNKKENESPIYRCPGFPNLIESFEDCFTLKDIILKQSKTYKDWPCFANRDENGNYNFLTYSEVYEKAKNVGKFIIQKELAPLLKEYENYEIRCVGMFSRNRVEWMLVDIANALYKIVMVPIQDQSSEEQIKHILKNSSIETCFCSSKNVSILLNMKNLVNLKNIICFDPITPQDQKNSEFRNINLIDFQQVQKAGSEMTQELAQVKHDDLVSFCYTSGTTGDAKAAILTNRNLVVACQECKRVSRVIPEDTYFSFLPLTHVLERCVVWTVYSIGGKICFYSGPIQNMIKDIPKVKPNVMVGVPKIYNRIYASINEQFNKLPLYKKFLVNIGLKRKIENLRKYGYRKNQFWDKLVFDQIRKMFGGSLNIVISGAAPLSAQVIEFLSVCLQCKVFQGYGSTETNGPIFIDYLCDKNAGNVGGPIASIEFKLIDIPDMGYFANQPDENGNILPKGEVCIRGPQIFSGYYKDREKTNSSFDEDGFFHTGDVGEVQLNGNLKIIDRKTNIFKLSIGEYISPEKVENIFIREPSVSEVYIYGNSMQNCCVGIVVPNSNVVNQIAQKLGLNQQSYEQLLSNQQVVQEIHQKINQFGTQEGLLRFELPLKIYLESQSFEQLGLLANLKIKRKIAQKHYQQILDNLYDSKKSQAD